MDKQQEFCDSLDDAVEELIARAARNAERCGLFLAGEIKKETPVDMGLLRAANTYQVIVDDGEIVILLANSMEYAPFVHQGTGIYAAAGDGRKTQWAYMDARGEWHTTNGQKPDPFMQRAIDKNKSKIEQFLGKGA